MRWAETVEVRKEHVSDDDTLIAYIYMNNGNETK